MTTDPRSIGAVNLRGWIEGDEDHVNLVRDSVTEAAPTDWYNLLWSFPPKSVAGQSCGFFGGRLSAEGVDQQLRQLRESVALVPAGAERQLRGLFVVSDEAGGATDVVQWLVRDRQVVVVPAGPDHAYLG